MPHAVTIPTPFTSEPDEHGRFGAFGGKYAPETLMAALEELEREYEKARRDRKFQSRLDELLSSYAGRPTPLFFAARLTKKLGGAKIYLKREDLLHTGAHKINNCLGQALLVERMGKHRVIEIFDTEAKNAVMREQMFRQRVGAIKNLLLVTFAPRHPDGKMQRANRRAHSAACE